MIKNIIFDIGNVLMTFSPVTYYKEIFHDEALTEKVCQAIFSHDAWLKYDQGVLFMKDLYEIYHKEYPQYQTEIDIILKDWMKLMQPMKISFSLMQRLKKEGYHIYILSNISKDSADYLKANQPFFDWSDGCVLSYEEKIVKPDTRIYQILLKRYNLKAEECLFIDDNEKNIIAAKEMGIHGITLDQSDQIETYVNTYLEKTTC